MEKLAAKKINSWWNIPWPKNWVLKLISFFFALFLWYFVVGEDKVDMTITIPIEILNLPQNLIISNQFKNQLEVTVNGPRGLVRNLSNQHISRSIDLSKATPGTIVVKNTPDSIPMPRGVRLLRIKPTDIILHLDKLIQKKIPIKAEINGKPPQGFELVSVRLDPPSLSITGPQSIISEEVSVTTVPIDVSNLTTSTMTTVALDLNSAIRELVGEPVVTANIEIHEKMEEKTIKGIPLHLVLAEDREFSLEPGSVTVKALIPYTLLQKDKELKKLFKGRINGGEPSPGKHKLTIEVVAPPGVEILEIAPPMVIVDIKEKEPKEEQPESQ